MRSARSEEVGRYSKWRDVSVKITGVLYISKARTEVDAVSKVRQRARVGVGRVPTQVRCSWVMVDDRAGNKERRVEGLSRWASGSRMAERGSEEGTPKSRSVPGLRSGLNTAREPE